MAGTFVSDTIQNGAGVSTSTTNVIQGCAKAWVNFNGTGTVAIRASYNVSSITDNGTGYYTVNFTNALPDANYCVVGMTNQQSGDSTNALIQLVGTVAPTTTSFRVYTVFGNQAVTDRDYVFLSIFD
jgi:hypothetical protein